ncbi:MAG: 3-hydroxyacyl-CoA dehydrogenase NAD-binding domain-containing protein [Gemmataceae bacterium]
MQPAGEGVVLLLIDVPARSMNVITPQVMVDLEAALERLQRDPALRLLIIRGAKSTGFIAGADVREFQKIANPEQAKELSAKGQELFAKLADFPFPTLAAIHGPCLGGGLELALACDYRTALDQPSTQLGLPEVELGLLPAWGGTQRLPRVIGLERTLKVILAGKRLSAPEALRWGLVDAVGRDQNEWLSAIDRVSKTALAEGKRSRRRLTLRSWRQRILESNALGRHLLFRGTERLLKKRVPEDMPAPWEALQTIKVGLDRGLDAGLQREREAAARLATSNACHNLVNLFLQRERARDIAKGDQANAPSVARVGIVGAGVMGAGIAQLAAIKGYQVIVQEVNDAALGAGMLRIAGLIQKAVERKLLSESEAREKLAAIQGTTEWRGFDGVDLVVEAAIEDKQAKQNLFRELDRRTGPETPLATNTSSLAVSELEQGLSHPERVAGLHFFNPVHKMPLVEVVRTPKTLDSVAKQLARWAVKLGKTPVIVGDGPGFVVNRILMPYLAEAVLLVAEKLPIDQIDQTMQRFGMPMGPLDLLDQVGLDIAAHVGRSVQPALGSRLALAGSNPFQVFEGLIAKGWLGQKSGTGFYRHQGKRKKVNEMAANFIVQELGSSVGGNLSDLPASAAMTEARERLVLLMVNEAAMVLEEGLAEDAEAIDLAMVLGTGWAPHRGGPLHYAQQRGVANCIKALEDRAERIGPRFAPSTGLRKLNK